MRLHEKANAFALYLVSDLYCILSKFVENILLMLLNSQNLQNLNYKRCTIFVYTEALHVYDIDYHNVNF